MLKRLFPKYKSVDEVVDQEIGDTLNNELTIDWGEPSIEEENYSLVSKQIQVLQIKEEELTEDITRLIEERRQTRLSLEAFQAARNVLQGIPAAEPVGITQ